MNKKCTMTLNLTKEEMDVLQHLAYKKEISKTALLRQALRIYQVIDLRLEQGEKLFFEDSDLKKSEILVL